VRFDVVGAAEAAMLFVIRSESIAASAVPTTAGQRCSALQNSWSPEATTA